MRRFFGAEAGAVSIYFIAATAAFVLLTALLIDYARIAAFRKQAELSVKSGARSVLSSFDPVVYARYGLFIRGGEAAEALFRETLQGNAVSPRAGFFPFLDTRWENVEVTESRPLATHEVFGRQVLEEMKYKAPIDLTLELAARFRGLSGVVKEARNTVDHLERMREAYDRREAALDKALERQRQHGGEVARLLKAFVPSPPMPLAAREANGVVANVVDAAAQYDDYVDKRREDEARLEAIRHEEERREQGEEETSPSSSLEKPQHEALIAAYETSTAKLAASMGAMSASLRLASERFLASARDAWFEARTANEEMERIAQEAGTVSASGDDEEAAADAEALAELRRTAESLVLDERFFAQYEAEIRQQHAEGISLADRASDFSALAAAVPQSSGLGEALRGKADRLQNDCSAYGTKYAAPGEILEARVSAFGAYRSHDEARKQEEEKAKSAWSGAARFLNALSGKSGTMEEREAFARVSDLYRRNLEWNRTEAEHAEASLPAGPAEGRDAAMSGADGVLDMLGSVLLGARDQLYFSEYAIARFSHYDPAYIKEMLDGGDAPLDLERQEAEYVLYGLNNPAGNIAAAYGEIFAFRLAIRTAEGLMECRGMGHPLLVLAAALAYGISHALLDLYRLAEQDSVPLAKRLKVDTSYIDYLRLFLLLHGGSSNKMARMIAVMELRTGLSFEGAYTYMSGEGTASVKLWFFPGLLRLTGRFGSLGGTVKGNRYEAIYIADSAYQ